MTRARRTLVFYAVAALFMAACMLITMTADAWLAPAPHFDAREGALVIEGDRLLDCMPLESKSIEVLPEGVRLYENLDLAFHATTTGEGTTPLFIVARGRPLDGVWPLLTLRLDRNLHDGLFVTSRDWGLYRFEIEAKPGEHHFRISYANDRSRFPVNRDLDIFKIAVGGPPPGWESYTGRSEASHFDILPLGEGLTIPASMLSVDAPGILQEDGSRLLWSNGHVSRSISNETARRIRMTLVARGELCEGRGPRLLLMVGDDQLTTIDVDETEFHPYAIDLDLAPGVQDIKAIYSNDSYVAGECDRNLHLLELRLEEAP